MPLFRIIRSYRRKSMRRRLVCHVIAGARIAHLPVFLDREPREDLHRAYQMAFMRGFRKEQRAI